MLKDLPQNTRITLLLNLFSSTLASVTGLFTQAMAAPVVSRYVHLNPAMIAAVKEKSVTERVDQLRKYAWSSYPAYAGLAERNTFDRYDPVLALVEGRKKDRHRRYREFVESGLAGNDEEFAAVMVRSAHCIGGDDFREAARVLGLKSGVAVSGFAAERSGAANPKSRSIRLFGALVGRPRAGGVPLHPSEGRQRSRPDCDGAPARMRRDCATPLR